MKTRREKLESLAAALKAFLPNYFTVDFDFSYSERKDLNRACLSLSEPDAPEQTADDVFRMWEKERPDLALTHMEGYWPLEALQKHPFVTAYRAWKLKQKPPKVPVFEITDELKSTLETVLYKHEIVPMETLVNNVATAIQSATAKDPT